MHYANNQDNGCFRFLPFSIFFFLRHVDDVKNLLRDDGGAKVFLLYFLFRFCALASSNGLKTHRREEKAFFCAR